MPRLDDPIHLDMYRDSRAPRTRLGRWFARLIAGLRGHRSAPSLYGYEWGHPDACPPLAHVRDHYVRAYVDGAKTALEIGPGGGRWTQYLTQFETLYVVDYHAELLGELRKNFDSPNMAFIHNSGADFPGVPDLSIDYLFSFGTFVHLDLDIIDDYLGNMRRILKPGADAIIQYADKTKLLAQQNPGFADNDPERMRDLLTKHDYSILEQDLTTLWHSSIVRFTVAS